MLIVVTICWLNCYVGLVNAHQLTQLGSFLFIRILFWSTRGTIERANLDGSGRTTIVSVQAKVYGLTLDFDLNRLYWCSYTKSSTKSYTSSLEYVNLDGRSVLILCSIIVRNRSLYSLFKLNVAAQCPKQATTPVSGQCMF